MNKLAITTILVATVLITSVFAVATSMQPVYGQALEPINSFPAPGSNIQGLAFGNGVLFAVNRDASTQSTIFKLNPTDGSIISSFNDPTLATGLAHDGTNLWTTRDSGTCAPPSVCNFINRLNPADGTIELTIPIDVTGGTGGLAFLGGSLWVVGAFGGFAVEILEVRPTDGATLSNFDVDALGIFPRELDASGTNLLYGTWVETLSGVFDFKVFKISTPGIVIGSDILFTVEANNVFETSNVVDINGLAFGDNKLYVADRASNQIFVFSFILSPQGVSIDIKPGSDPNCFNNDGHGVIPVAILGSDTFDVTQVDPLTLSLDSQAVKTKGNGDPQTNIEDVNGDGFDDLVVKIIDSDGIYTVGTGTATLTGQLFDGTDIEGTDSICITQ